MWHTQLGDRDLEGAEARLFQEGACNLVDTIMHDHDELEMETTVGVAVFDDLSYEQQLLMLEAVTHALTGRTEMIPAQTAVNEATIAAVFEHIRAEVEAELEFDGGKKYRTFRKLLLEAAGDDEQEDGVRPNAASHDMDMWNDLIERALERITWDCDWEFFDTVVSDRAKQTLGESGFTEYFSAKVPPPNEIPVKSILRGFAHLRHELKKSKEQTSKA